MAFRPRCESITRAVRPIFGQSSNTPDRIQTKLRILERQLKHLLGVGWCERTPLKLLVANALICEFVQLPMRLGGPTLRFGIVNQHLHAFQLFLARQHNILENFDSGIDGQRVGVARAGY